MAANGTTGVVVSFDDQHGFGFIRSHAYREDVFVHARVVDQGVALKPGQRVRFDAEPSENGPRAVWVKPGRRGLTPNRTFTVVLALVLAAATIAWHVFARLSWPVAWLGAINPVTFAAFTWDKRQALLHNRRLPELLLITLSFLGGTPAALLAMAFLRHKTHKGSFQMKFGGMAALQVALLAGYWWLTQKP